MPPLKWPRNVELWGLSAVLLLGAFVVSTGFFTIDEAIHYLGARALADHGALGTDNGFDRFHSESLRLRYLVDGPHGLTPQYPVGSFLLASLFLPVLGIRAFILLNALAAIGTLLTLRKICLAHFGNEAVARLSIALLVLGTFWLEYAFGIWPHMLSTFFALLAYWYAVRHLDSGGAEHRKALLSGLAAGIGMLFRLDGALVVPAIGLIFLLFSPRFVRSLICFGSGVLPSIALLSFFNFLRFGSANPLSYGQAGGNSDLTAYGALFALLCIGFGALALWRTTARQVDRKLAVASAAVLVGALLFFPTANPVTVRLWNGLMTLVFDARSIELVRVGVERGPGNTLIAWGQVKKALGQSMPWLGLAVMALIGPTQRADRRSFGMLLIFSTVMTLPYILLSWHGGGGSNMRYFLPVVPLLCVLCAKLLSDLWTLVPQAMIWVALGLWTAVALCLGWILLNPSRFAGVQQILSTYVLAATALFSIAAAIPWRLRPAARRLTVAAVAAGLAMSMSFALLDFTAASQRRMSNFNGRLALAKLPKNSLIIAYPEWLGGDMPDNGSILSARDEITRQVDQKLVLDALAADYQVFIVNHEFDARRDLPPGVEPLPTEYLVPGGRMIELRRASPAPPDNG